MKEKLEHGPTELSLVAPIFSDSSDNDEEQSNAVATTGSAYKTTGEVDQPQINTVKPNSKHDIRSCENKKISVNSFLEFSDTEIQSSSLSENKVKKITVSKIDKLDSNLDDNVEKVPNNINSKDGGLESSSAEVSGTKYNMKYESKRKSIKHYNSDNSKTQSVQANETHSVDQNSQKNLGTNPKLPYFDDKPEKNCIGEEITGGKIEELEAVSDEKSKCSDGMKGEKESQLKRIESESEDTENNQNKSSSKAKTNDSGIKNKDLKYKDLQRKKVKSESSSDEDCETKDAKRYSKNSSEDTNKSKSSQSDVSVKEGSHSSSDEKPFKADKKQSKSKVNRNELTNKMSCKSPKKELDLPSRSESKRSHAKKEKTQVKSEIKEKATSLDNNKVINTDSNCENDDDKIKSQSDEEIEYESKDVAFEEEVCDDSTLDDLNESKNFLDEEKSPVVDVSSDESPIKRTKFVGFTSTEEEDEEIKEHDEEESTKSKTKSLKKRSVRNKKLKMLNSSVDESGTEDDDVGCDEKGNTSKKDADVVLSSAASSDSEVIPLKKSRRKAPNDYDLLEEAENKLKKKRKRVQCADSSDESGSGKEKSKKKATDGESPAKIGRKNIKKIKTKEDLAEATLEAAEEEKERRRRIEERQKLFNEVFEVKESQAVDQLVLDFDVDKKEELVSVHKDLVAKMKPHQAKGVKFMWDSCFESLNQLKKKKGSGCILAHCMGLGKTFQVVSLIHTLITHEETGVRLVMVVCPLSTVLNWVNEFSKWLADIEGAEDDIEVFHLTRYKTNPDRARELRRWHLNGGVLVIGYEMFRNLSSEAAKKFRPKIRKDFQESLIDPGADLIVCDEGHMLKNEATALSKAMTRVRTLRRIVLTGTPMQNNLVEYHCMVQFVKPNLLGTKREFLNRFVNPITNGSFVDSTERDVKVMKRRAHVLHKMLEGLVQRFDYNVLTPFLPPKHEYVINVSLSELQVKLYREYLDNHSQQANDKKAGSRLFQDWQALGRVWTHPRVIKMSTDRANLLQEKKMLEMSDDEEGSLKDFIDDDDDSDTAESTPEASEDSGSDSSAGGKKKKKVLNTRGTRRTRAMAAAKNFLDSEEEGGEPEVVGEVESGQDKGWWSDLVEPEHLDDITLSGKLVLLFAILRECELIQDKVLVFSQSLFSLDLIEYFLDKIDSATQEDKVEPTLGGHQGTWSRGLDYFRLDGSTSSENRSLWCANFNREDNPRARLFLISTRAGGLGINLTAANRVIIFDASWNPSHDVQSIFRIYRFGQKKPCYIYRFIAHGTMEEKVYDRQVSKQSMSNRVVDEMQMHRHFSMNDLTELYSFTPPSDPATRPTPALPTDRLLAELLREQGSWIEKYHEHDSLLENVVEEELNEEERKLAWEDYENDKKNVNTNVNAGLNPMTQQIEFIRQQIKAKYPDKTEQEQQQILVYQVSLLMKQQQEQKMKQAQAQAQLQAQYQAQYQAQIAAMAGGRGGPLPQMYPGAKAGQGQAGAAAGAGQPQMQPWQMQMQMQYINQLRRQQQQQQLLQQQQQANQQRSQAIEMMRMQQKLLSQNQDNKGVVITELPDEPSNPET